ncbi:MAG TPA: class I SAM-dependent methyltransferase [Bacillota bacterium]|nr:class I SAM-dependent methyltransferase [Peptococcaceae bacterium MAG4]NLW38573.1 class I SAM-dependent methyltransferase [Peptococcaceae bacterium]HPU35326.1 class I SAM-dependent methyltransferase [Bacillota bacterium]HPZ42809.1 class I SAM-dependent methyltransferase [Bacillota bacterium]HQD75314.1 class I SAM-dependent methyltransferase [Bacillota bacterium]
MHLTSQESVQVYEREELRRATGNTIRPGGFTLTNRALSFCSFSPQDRILDVGCGTGATVEHLINNYKLRATGVDPSPLLLECGKQKNPGLPLIQAVGEELPFADGEFDGVFAECSFSLLKNARQALGEFYRVLKPNGRLVISDIYIRNPEETAQLRSLPLYGCLGGARTRTELEDLLTSSGYKIVLWEDHSKLLAAFTAQLILSGSSLDIFWGKPPCGPDGCQDIRKIIKKARPGYFLLIAVKEGTRKFHESCSE